jgi:hypothetical protein
MIQKILPSALFLLLITTPLRSDLAFSRSIKTVTADEGSVVVVKTSIGYSTILEFTSKPLSAVLGDQDSFKLEYVGNSLTLKPLYPRAKSNLFVFTEFDRFNCEVQTVPPSQVDYIIRVRTKKKSYPVVTAEDSRIEIPIHKSSSYDGFSVKIVSISHEKKNARPRAVTLIDFELGTLKNSYSFQPASIGVKQSGKFIPAESLYMDSLELTPSQPPIHGKFAILDQDYLVRQPIEIVFAVPDSKNPKKVHRIAVSTRTSSQALKPKKKGGDPWEVGSGSTTIFSPKPTPTRGAEEFKLKGLQFAPSSF